MAGKRRHEILDEALSKFPHQMDGYDFGYEKHVYVLECRKRKEVWYYVGHTKDVVKRISQHLHADLDINSDSAIVKDLERIVPVKPHERAREVERRTAYQVAIDKETTNIIGLTP